MLGRHSGGMSGDVETYHEDEQWHNRIEGSGRVIGSYDTKDEAVAAGRDEARERQVEHLIKGMDGRISERNSYGNDPRDIPG